MSQAARSRPGSRWLTRSRSRPGGPAYPDLLAGTDPRPAPLSGFAEAPTTPIIDPVTNQPIYPIGNALIPRLQPNSAPGVGNSLGDPWAVASGDE